MWGVPTLSQPHWVCPHSLCVCFPGLHCSGSRLLCRELSKTGHGLCVVPRSKPLMFRFSDTSQRCRVSWACVLCLSQIPAAQATRCLVSSLSPGGMMCLITSPISAAWFSAGVPSQVCRVGRDSPPPFWQDFGNKSCNLALSEVDQCCP